ncbi:MAG TPA: exodeoxyribonuclease III, partial [Erysipelothrix sp.]|nr:exodeoxyribonuclease III [Erysipelothrix sp.]
MKLVSWNVNGLRAILNKDFNKQFKDMDADVFCLQEIKLQEDQNEFYPDGYHAYYNYALKKGYSGVGVLTKEEPLNVTYGLDIEAHDQEGRLITCEYDAFYLLCVYTPNSQSKLKRLDYRMQWEEDFQTYVADLEKNKPVIITGDLNVAHKEIDLKNPKTNRKNAGFSDEERAKMTDLLSLGYVDSFRYIHGDVI